MSIFRTGAALALAATMAIAGTSAVAGNGKAAVAGMATGGAVTAMAIGNGATIPLITGTTAVNASSLSFISKSTVVVGGAAVGAVAFIAGYTAWKAFEKLAGVDG